MASQAAKDAKRLAEMQLCGSNSPEARDAVRLQRELKKKNDALRKAEKLHRSFGPGDKSPAAVAAAASVATLTREVKELEQRQQPSPPPCVSSAAVSGGGGSGGPTAASPASMQPSPSPSPVPPVVPPSSPVPLKTTQPTDKDEKKASEMRLSGQNSEESKAAVKRQREAKKKKDALRKLQKSLKAMTTGADGYGTMREEEERLLSEIAALEGYAEGPLPAGKQSAVAGPVSSAAFPPVTTAAGQTHPPLPATAKAVVEETAEEKEETAKRLQAIVERAIRANTLERLVVSRRDSIIHPRVAEVALLMEKMMIVGGSARTLALISAFRALLESTTVLAGTSMNEIDTNAFETVVRTNFDFLRRTREATSGMRYVKDALVRRVVALREEVIHPKPATASLVASLGDPREASLQILEMIEAELTMSFKSIVVERSLPYVSNSDTILVFGRSSVVEYILLSRSRDPMRRPKKVIVVDSAPLFEGRELAAKLSKAGIQVVYGLITACCTLMPKCTRVFMGASAVLQNGDVFGRCGAALVAACAKLFRKPVLCFCESHKFVAEVWVGNLAQNSKLADIRPAPDTHGGESGVRSPLSFPTPPTLSPTPGSSRFIGGGGATSRADLFPRGNSTAAAAASSSSAASGYLYDLTPAAYVDMIICEMGCLHTSAIFAAIKDREGRDASPLMYFVKD